MLSDLLKVEQDVFKLALVYRSTGQDANVLLLQQACTAGRATTRRPCSCRASSAPSAVTSDPPLDCNHTVQTRLGWTRSHVTSIMQQTEEQRGFTEQHVLTERTQQPDV